MQRPESRADSMGRCNMSWWQPTGAMTASPRTSQLVKLVAQFWAAERVEVVASVLCPKHLGQVYGYSFGTFQ